MLSILRNKNELDLQKYFIVKYFLESKTTLEDAAWNLAIGQSVGNPKVRNHWETDELFENHSCKIITPNNPHLLQEKSGVIEIAFPSINIDFNTDGISHLLVNIMGGQMDINDIDKCQVLDIIFPDYVHKSFLGPKFGIKGIREFTGVKDKPLFGAIVKPKTGITPQVLLEMVKELVEGGVNFIKEDEILSDPSFICSWWVFC